MKHLVKDGIIIRSGIPSSFTRDNGETFWGGYETMTNLHYEDGWRDEVNPEYDVFTQIPRDRYYDPVDDVVKYFIIDIELPALEKAKLNKIIELREAVKPLYQLVQWYVEMCRIDGTNIPTVVLNKIKVIKTKYEQAKNQINGFTNVRDVLAWNIPYDQIASIKTDLESII